jgi:hypothetical protein
MGITASSFVLFYSVVLLTMSTYSYIKTCHVGYDESPELICTCGITIDRSVISLDEPNGKLNDNFLADIFTAVIASIDASGTITQDKPCIKPIVLLIPIIFTNPNHKEMVFKLNGLPCLKADLDYCVTNTKMIYFHFMFQTGII